MKLLVVTGSRDWEDEDAIERAILSFAPDFVMHGQCEGKRRKGTDKIADEICLKRGIQPIRLPALWDCFNLSAGPKRNQKMADLAIELAYAQWVVKVAAFPLPGSRGTIDMMKRSRDGGLYVVNHAESSR